MANILVFCEFGSSGLKKSTLELLSAARKSGMKIQALALGTGAKALSGALGQEGVDEAVLGEDSALDKYNPELFTDLVAGVLNSKKPAVVLASSSSLARDLFPRVAARLQTGTISDCTELEISSSGDVK